MGQQCNRSPDHFSATVKLPEEIFKKLGVLYPGFESLCVTEKGNTGILQTSLSLNAFVS